MPDMIPVKIRPLSGEALRPYGQVLERGGTPQGLFQRRAHHDDY